MDDGLQIRRIVVDSRTATVGTGQDFEVQLPETLSIPRAYGCYVTDVCLSHSWHTVHGDTSVGVRNHYLYFMERLWYPSGPGDYTVLNRCTLTQRSFAPTELATEIQTQMNAVSFFGPTAYTVTYSTLVSSMYVSLGFPGDPTYTLYHGFQLLSTKVSKDATFRTYAQSRQLYNTNATPFPNSAPTAFAVDWGNLEDASGLLGVDTGPSGGAATAMNTLITNSATSYQWPKTFATGTVDVRQISVVYLHSNALSNFNTMGQLARGLFLLGSRSRG